MLQFQAKIENPIALHVREIWDDPCGCDSPHLSCRIGGGRSPANTHEGENLNFNHEKLQTSTRMNIQVRNAVVVINVHTQGKGSVT